MGQIQVAADVGERFRQGLGPSGPHVVQALADALENAGFLGCFLLAEQADGSRHHLVRGRESAASHLGLHELLEVCGQMSVHIRRLLAASAYHAGKDLSSYGGQCVHAISFCIIPGSG
jgi:hypothetical protein